MQRVYLLLRNNRESGPFTIGELLQQQLKPSDLVWVEGKSTTWTPLAELELFSAAELARLEQPKPVYPSFVLSPRQADHAHPKPEEPAHDAYSAEETIDFIDHRKEKNTSLHETITGVFVTLFVGASVIGGKTLFFSQHQSMENSAVKLVSRDHHTAARPKQQVVVVAAPDTSEAAKADSLYRIAAKPKPAVKRQVELVKRDSAMDMPAAAVVQKEEPVDTKAVIKTEEKKPEEKKVEDKIDTKKEVAVPATEEAAPVEKRKTLGQVLKGLFKKKKKEEKADSTSAKGHDQKD